MQVDDEVLEELELGSYGSDFISWEMVLALMVLEGGGKDRKGKAGAKDKRKEAAVAQEEDVPTENISEHDEALMALMLLQSEQQVEEEEDRMIEGDEVLEEAPDLAIPYLHPIVLDGVEFLLLDDVIKALGLREDEALSALAMHAGMRDPANPSVDEESAIDFDEPSAMNMLEYHTFKAEPSLEQTVVKALVEIKASAHLYDLPESAFVPHKPYVVQDGDDGGSLNIIKPEIIEADDLVETAMEVDKFAMRTGGARVPSEGARDTSLWHYLPSLSPSILRVAHHNYSENGHAEVYKCKAMSSVLSDDSLTLNANKCILVNREAALYSYCGKQSAAVLAHCALSLGQGINNPAQIAQTLGETSKVLAMDAEKVLQRF